MVFKQRWTVMTAGAMALAGSVCFVGLGAREAAAEPLRLAATHQQLATNSNQDGTATMTLAITLTNVGLVAGEDVRLILLKELGMPVMPGRNVLTVGTLAAGQTVTLSWPITVLAPVAPTRGDPPLMVIHAEGVAADGTTPLSTGVLSRARNHPRSSSNGPVTEPATADPEIARERVSVDSAGDQGNSESYPPAISADGRFVTFSSNADNLVPGGTNSASDVFVHDRKTGATERVSVDSAGKQVNDFAPTTGTPTAGAAQWLEESSFVASSLETGRIGYLEAWGGDEFGYAYTYSLSGQPTGVSVDQDTGMLSLGSALSPGTYGFSAIVTNRRVTSKVATFPISITVNQGVTANRTGNQILHKTYDVHDTASFGPPSGTDWTNVLMNVRQAIINDQIAAGDGNLRATIHFRRGNQYNYTNNRWSWGLQYLTVEPDPTYNPSGPIPKLQDTLPSCGGCVGEVILQFGQVFIGNTSATSGWIDDTINSYPINTVTIGASTITLKNSADAANLKVGRYIFVASYDQQFGGFPPNFRYFDYVKVLSVNGATITLDRKVKHNHKDNYPVGDGLGAARIIVVDRDDNNRRATIRGTLRDLEFVTNPAVSGGATVQMAGPIDVSVERCVIPHAVPSTMRFIRYAGGSIQDSESDKNISMEIYDGMSSGPQDLMATGVEYYLVRDSNMRSSLLDPRQLRAIRSTFNATGDTVFQSPLIFMNTNPVKRVELFNSVLRRDEGDSNSWGTWWPAASVTIGTHASWNGNQLVVDNGNSNWIIFAGGIFEGAIVYTGSSPSRNWGVVTNLTGDATHLFADIDWRQGARPRTGGVLAFESTHDVYADPSSSVVGITWGDPRSPRYITPTINRQFSAGYPASTYGF